MTECCGNCRFYHNVVPHLELYGSNPPSRNGQCRRRAPTPAPYVNFLQPCVDEAYWCGEWEQGEETHGEQA